MASVTVYSTDKVDELTDAAVVGGAFSSGHLILSRADGTPVDVGVYTDATATDKGIVELASDAESVAGTDSTRAVTPFGLAAVTAAIKAAPIVATSTVETAAPSAYPMGVSLLSLTTSSWSLNGGVGSVLTTRTDNDHTVQTFYSTGIGASGFPRKWTRQYISATPGWSAWQELQFVYTLTPASFLQTTAFTSYPQGTSRLYFTTANAATWDFTGKAGEVVTYRDGTDFARQTWTKHVGGTTAATETWIRTANSTSGWTNWLIVAEDTGWVSLGTLNSGFTAALAGQCRRIAGVVYLRGSFTTTTSGAYNASGWVLPVGYRPSVSIGFPVTSNSTSVMSGFITNAGIIQAYISATTGATFHVTGVSFPIN
jgi:hypothetical protein